MFRSYGGGPGLDYVFARFKPRLERELGRELSHRIFVENPARAFAFERPSNGLLQGRSAPAGGARPRPWLPSLARAAQRAVCESPQSGATLSRSGAT